MADEKDPRDMDMERIKDAIDRLAAHFGSIQVFATKPGTNGGTLSFHEGHGNWFARYGQVKEWVTKEEEISRTQVRS